MKRIKCTSELLYEVVKQLTKRFIWFKNIESIGISTNDFVIIEVQSRDGFRIGNNGGKIDIEISSSNDIEPALENIYRTEIQPIPINICLNAFAFIRPILSISFDKIILTYGNKQEIIPFEVFETLSSMYTYTWCSPNVRLVSQSKHTFEINGKQVGTILLQDLIFIRDLSIAFTSEFSQFLTGEIPNYSKFEEAVSKYLSPYMTGIFSSYLNHQKSTVSKIFCNTLHQLDVMKNSYIPEKSKAIKIPPTGISEQR